LALNGAPVLVLAPAQVETSGTLIRQSGFATHTLYLREWARIECLQSSDRFRGALGHSFSAQSSLIYNLRLNCTNEPTPGSLRAVDLLSVKAMVTQSYFAWQPFRGWMAVSRILGRGVSAKVLAFA
jgi:hypothetical protein